MAQSGLNPDDLTSLDRATATLFDESAELVNAEEWLLQTDYAASRNSAVQEFWRRRRDLMQSVLTEKLLPEVRSVRFSTPTIERGVPEVLFETPYGMVPIQKISQGYRTLIGWVVDLASRLFANFPESNDPLSEPAIVLVDEIDLHLHPCWQRQVMSFLTERFPNIQFIVTAHSPLIVQAASSVNANLALLRRDGDHVVIDNDVDQIRNWRIDQILTSELFGLETARPPEVEPKLERRKQLLSQAKLSAGDKKELARLEADIGPLPTGESAAEARDMLQLAQEATAVLQKYQGQRRDSN
jgi:hypothetical protein